MHKKVTGKKKNGKIKNDFFLDPQDLGSALDRKSFTIFFPEFLTMYVCVVRVRARTFEQKSRKFEFRVFFKFTISYVSIYDTNV